MIRKIAVIGATGMLGKPVTKAIVRAGFEVSALMRDVETATRELPKEVSLIKGDIRNTADIEKLLAHAEGLYISLNLKQTEKKSEFHAEGEGLRNIVAVAKKCGVKRIAFISSLVMRYQDMNDFHWWVFDIKKAAVEMIRSSGIPYTIFYPSNFMESLNGNYRQGNRMMLAGESRYKMYFIAASDYGDQVSNSFKRLDGENKEYVVQGPEGFIGDDAVVEFVKYYSKSKLSIAKAPIGLLKVGGLFSQKMNYGYHIITALNNYPETFEAMNTWEELGRPTITIREFAQML